MKDIIQDKDSDKEDEYGRFCTAAKVKSTCKTGKEDSGNLGVFTYGDLELPESFNDFVFHDKIGTTLGPVESDFGWHLIFVREGTILISVCQNFPKITPKQKTIPRQRVTTQELKDQKKKELKYKNTYYFLFVHCVSCVCTRIFLNTRTNHRIVC